MKKQKIQEELDKEDNKKKDKKKQDFGEDLEYAWYKRSPI